MRTALKLSLAALALTVAAILPNPARADYVLTITDVEGANTYTAQVDITNGTVLPNSGPLSGAGITITTNPASVVTSTNGLGGTAGTDASFTLTATLGNIAFNVSTGTETIGTYLASLDLALSVRSGSNAAATSYFGGGGTATVTTTLTQDNINLPAGYPNVALNLSGGGTTHGTQDLSLLYNGSTPAGLGPISATTLGGLPNGATGTAGLTYPFTLGITDVMTFGATGQVSSGDYEVQAYVPEPGTLGIFGTGLSLLGLCRARRRRKLAA